MTNKKKNLVLGISNSHDAGVAIIHDGNVLAAINEERFNRKKNASGFPHLCIEKIWDIAGVSPHEITRVAVAGTALGAPPLNNDFSDDNGRYSFSQVLAEKIDLMPFGNTVLSSDITSSLYRKFIRMRMNTQFPEIVELIKAVGVDAPMEAIEHHDAHVAAAYYASGDASSLVISNDGFGDGMCAKVGLVEHSGEELKIISNNVFFNSLGTYYNYVTHFCGFMKGHHAGKTTGLAAYGDATKTIEIFRKLIEWDEKKGIYVNKGKLFRNCLYDVHNKLKGFSREDAAAGIQQHLEDILVSMIKHYILKTGRNKVALVGGVHANVKVNQRIAALSEVDHVYVFPNMGDGGLALGAAYLSWAKANDWKVEPVGLSSTYLGPEFTEDEVVNSLAAADGIDWHKSDNIAKHVAECLRDGKIVARFDGRMEYGPRALGNRSILYTAADKEVNQWLNKQLHRTEFMPFAPVIREEDAADYFIGVNEKIRMATEFMTITCDVTERCIKEAPAVVHVDNTARPQIISRGSNPDYYDILTEYKKLTGLSILVNTSFNMHEEPIVCTPDDAIKAFLDSHLDVLAIGPFSVKNVNKAIVAASA